MGLIYGSRHVPCSRNSWSVALMGRNFECITFCAFTEVWHIGKWMENCLASSVIADMPLLCFHCRKPRSCIYSYDLAVSYLPVLYIQNSPLLQDHTSGIQHVSTLLGAPKPASRAPGVLHTNSGWSCIMYTQSRLGKLTWTCFWPDSLSGRFRPCQGNG